jgi:peptidyl-prolyl cis-trans isomerase C
MEGKIMPFETVREKIADMLEARSWSVEAGRYIAELARRGQVDGIRIEGTHG